MGFLAEITIDSPSTDGLDETLLDLVLGNPKIIAVVIVAGLFIAAARALGGATASIVGKFSFPVGIVVAVAILGAIVTLKG